MGQPIERSRLQRPLAALLGVLLLAVSLPSGATPPIRHAQAGRSDQPELIERVVVYLRALSVQAVKPTLGTEDPQQDASPAEPDGAPRFGHPVRIELPYPMTEAAALAWAAQQVDGATVAGVVADRRIRSHGSISTNDSLAYVLWNLAAGDAGTTMTEPVWPQGRGTGVRVAVLDTGRVDHPDMQGAWLGGYDFISDTGHAGDGDGRDADPTDTMVCDGGSGQEAGTPHGLHVASIIGARMNNNEGLAGVAPEADIVPVRSISSCGGYLSDVLDAMRWAAGLSVSGVPDNPHPAKVLNLSLGTTSPGATCGPSVQAVVDEVLATGATIVVSTGNDGEDTITVPAACNGVIAVAAGSKDGKRTDYSNAGPGTTLTAAGGGCAPGAPAGCSSNAYNYVAIANHTGVVTDYRMGAGTSYAAPHVSGAVALLLERDANRTPADMKSLLTNGARPFAVGACPGDLCGPGLLDVEAALAAQGFTLSASAQAADARAGDSVLLQASASAGAISPVFTWSQLSGPAVVLTPENGGRDARFAAPETDATLEFQVSVTDNSATTRTAATTVRVSVAPVLAPVERIEVTPGTDIRQPMRLVDGDAPQAIAVDAGAIAKGVQVDGADIVWNDPPQGEYTVRVTPYDSVGAGVPVDLDVSVAAVAKTDTATENPMGGGGGMVGWHGAVLLIIAGWLLRRAARDPLLPNMPRRPASERSMRAGSNVAGAVAVAIVLVALAGVGAGAAHSAGASPLALWWASFAHLDATHLAVNLLGLLLVQAVFARAIDPRAWAFALLVAAPAAHAIVVALGQHAWVAGLSTALHAVAAWAIACYWIVGQAQGRGPGAWLMAGLVLKLALDGVIVTVWPEAGAQSSQALHAWAAAIGGLAGCAAGTQRLRRLRAAVPVRSPDHGRRSR